MITVGMDVHVRNSYLHVTDDAGNVMRHGRCPNTLGDLAEFLGPIERGAVQRGEDDQSESEVLDGPSRVIRGQGVDSGLQNPGTERGERVGEQDPDGSEREGPPVGSKPRKHLGERLDDSTPA